MECLTPPLDSVPVEEWFCPGCEASNRHSSTTLNYLQKKKKSSNNILHLLVLYRLDTNDHI